MWQTNRPMHVAWGWVSKEKGLNTLSEYKLGSVQLAALSEVPGWSLHGPGPHAAKSRSRRLALPKSGFPVNSLKSHLSIEHEE